MNIAALDLVVLIVFLVGSIAVGLWFSRKSGENSESFFLAGRTLTWPFIGASMFATNISAHQFIGQGGLAYTVGVGASIWQLIGVVGIFLLGMVFLPKFLHMRLYTLPQFLEDRYGRSVRSFISGYSIILIITTLLTGSLYAGALILQKLLGMDSVFSLYVFIVVLAVASTFYTYLGGLKAVVLTDFIQNIVLILGGVLTLVFALLYVSKMDGGFAALANLKEVTDGGEVFSKWSMYRPANHQGIPFLGIVTGALVMGVGVHCFSHEYVQRGLGAKNIYHGKMGALFGCVLKVVAIFIIGVPGVLASYILKDQGVAANESIIVLIMKILPVGIVGIVLAGLIAAIMSTIDSALCACSSLFTIDFYQKKNPDVSEKKSVLVGRIAMLVCVIVGILMCPFIASFEHIFQYIQAITGYIVGPMVVVYLAGLYFPRSNNQAAVATLLIGIVTGLGAFFINNLINFAEGTFADVPLIRNALLAAYDFLPAWLTGLHFLYVCFALFVLSSVVMIVVSYVTPPPPPECRDAAKLHDHGAFETKTVHGRRKIAIMIGVLVIITAITIWVFR
jgi:SSS family solute:Na+ symporter